MLSRTADRFLRRVLPLQLRNALARVLDPLVQLNEGDLHLRLADLASQFTKIMRTPALNSLAGELISPLGDFLLEAPHLRADEHVELILRWRWQRVHERHF